MTESIQQEISARVKTGIPHVPNFSKVIQNIIDASRLRTVRETTQYIHGQQIKFRFIFNPHTGMYEYSTAREKVDVRALQDEIKSLLGI